MLRGIGTSCGRQCMHALAAGLYLPSRWRACRACLRVLRVARPQPPIRCKVPTCAVSCAAEATASLALRRMALQQVEWVCGRSNAGWRSPAAQAAGQRQRQQATSAAAGGRGVWHG